MCPGYIHFPVDRLVQRPIRPDEVRHVRQIWWNLNADGHRLPAEPGIISIDGDRQ